ncbi:MAG: hypothetical protein IPN56_13810 [Chitinophagaceae bacterium]|nr:hypothetical protein [Chitinophagaceae bacterium]
MKISTILCLTLFIVSGIPSFGQKTNPSRSETETWLLEKMNKYVAKNSIDCNKLFPGDNSINNKTTDCSTYTNISFSFSVDNLLISAKCKKESTMTMEMLRQILPEKLRFHCMTLAMIFT